MLAHEKPLMMIKSIWVSQLTCEAQDFHAKNITGND